MSRARMYTAAVLPAVALPLFATGSAHQAVHPPSKAELRENAKEKVAAEQTGLLRYFLAFHDAEVAEGWRLIYQAEVDRFTAAAQASVSPVTPSRPVAGTGKPSGRPQASTGPVSGASSGTCGGATNGADAFIGRESGGDPNAHNPSGATGCYQIMPRTWSSSCPDLGPQQGASTTAQAACASRLPSSAWAASGG